LGGTLPSEKKQLEGRGIRKDLKYSLYVSPVAKGLLFFHRKKLSKGRSRNISCTQKRENFGSEKKGCSGGFLRQYKKEKRGALYTKGGDGGPRGESLPYRKKGAKGGPERRRVAWFYTKRKGRAPFSKEARAKTKKKKKRKKRVENLREGSEGPKGGEGYGREVKGGAMSNLMGKRKGEGPTKKRGEPPLRERGKVSERRGGGGGRGVFFGTSRL